MAHTRGPLTASITVNKIPIHMKKIIIWIGGLIIFYLCICLFLYFIQENLIFHPKKLPSDYHFQFNADFQELNMNTANGLKLNGF